MVNQITEIVKLAGKIAMNLYGRESGHLKSDGTWVTRADSLIEIFLRQELHGILEAHIYGEEGGWTGEESAPYVVIIDPIDGTCPFRDQVPIWGISVGIYYKNQPYIGVFDMPATGHFFLGEFGKGSQWNGKTITTPSNPITGTSYLGVSSDAHHLGLSEYPGKIRAFGVSGYHVILVATGALQATLLSRFKFHDIASASIILWSAGGGLYYLSGETISATDIIKMEKPLQSVIACHPNNLDETRKYIHYKEANADFSA